MLVVRGISDHGSLGVVYKIVLVCGQLPLHKLAGVGTLDPIICLRYLLLVAPEILTEVVIHPLFLDRWHPLQGLWSNIIDVIIIINFVLLQLSVCLALAVLTAEGILLFLLADVVENDVVQGLIHGLINVSGLLVGVK